MTGADEPQAEEVAKIARGLTGQMRNALTWPKAGAIIPCTLWAGTLAGLDRRGLISRRTYSMTPLGRAVRAYLIRTQPRNEERNNG